jgi:pyrimidine operon attenuation protein/uracil phosphoribosyltransferase
MSKKIRTQVLTHEDIARKLERIAYQVFENNMDRKELFIGGLNERGYLIAEKIVHFLSRLTKARIVLFNCRLDKSAKDASGVEYSITSDKLKGKYVLFCDDVLNTGETLLKVMLPAITEGASTIEIAVLAERAHRLFPISANYIGTEMATHFEEHLYFNSDKNRKMELFLE